MAKKVPLPEDYQNITENLYEAVMVTARRARKIAADQKIEIEKEMHQVVLEPSENPDAEDVVRQETDGIYLQLEKPTKIAFRELANLDLEWEYREK